MADESDKKQPSGGAIVQAVIRPAGKKDNDAPISSTVAIPVVPDPNTPSEPAPREGQGDALGETRPSAMAMTVCPTCKTATPVAKFCSECGSPLVPRRFCTECGTKLVAGSKFCEACGTKVP